MAGGNRGHQSGLGDETQFHPRRRKQPHLWRPQGESPGWSHGLEPLWEEGRPVSSHPCCPFPVSHLQSWWVDGCCGGWFSSAQHAAPGLPYKALTVPPKPSFQVRPHTPPTAREMGVGCRYNLPPRPTLSRSCQSVFHSGCGGKGRAGTGRGQTGDRLSGSQNGSFYCIPWVAGFLVFYWTSIPWGGEGRRG